MTSLVEQRMAAVFLLLFVVHVEGGTAVSLGFRAPKPVEEVRISGGAGLPIDPVLLQQGTMAGDVCDLGYSLLLPHYHCHVRLFCDSQVRTAVYGG